MKQFTEAEIHFIYNTQVKHDITYYKKYERLPPCPVASWKYSWQNFDFPRNWCVLDFKEWIEKYNIRVDLLGYTCNTDPELEFISYKNKLLVDYPKFDLHTIHEYFNDYFDFFLFNQTLEHLYNPYMAMENLFKAMKSGGYVFTSVPTLNIPHMTPIHFNGFTPMGLAVLFKSAGFEIVEMGQWGNFEYIHKLWSAHSWPGFEMLQHDGVVVNEERNVCQCWILAKKP